MEESKRFELIHKIASVNSVLAGCSENLSDAIAALADNKSFDSQICELNRLGFVRGCLGDLFTLNLKLSEDIAELKESVEEINEALYEYERS